MENMIHTMRMTTEAQKRNSLAHIEKIRENLKKALEHGDILCEAEFVVSQTKELVKAVRRYRETEEKLEMLDMIEAGRE